MRSLYAGRLNITASWGVSTGKYFRNSDLRNINGPNLANTVFCSFIQCRGGGTGPAGLVLVVPFFAAGDTHAKFMESVIPP